VTDDATDIHAPAAVGRALRTPRSAAVAGIVFSVLFATTVVLIRLAVPADPAEDGAWVSDASRRDAVLLALGLVPFAGIAFLWFIGVVRDRVGEAEDRFFATVFLGSGLLFVAMFFASAAVAAALLASVEDDAGSLFSSGSWDLGRHMSHDLLTVYALRMAAVFTIATSTILLRTASAPRWLAVAGYAIAVVILVSAGYVPWIELLFPAWLLALSAHILVTGLRRRRGGPDDPPTA
jgi:hypothetical protein